MPTLYASKGLPASGKTFACRAFIDKHPEIVRANRDDIRMMLYNKRSGVDENTVTLVQRAIIDTALADGRDVYVDDTNLSTLAHDSLTAAAEKADALLCWFDYTNVPYALCIKRDAARPDPVGERVIGSMWERYLSPKAKKDSFVG